MQLIVKSHFKVRVTQVVPLAVASGEREVSGAVTLVLLTMVSAGKLWSSPRNGYHAVTAGVSALKAYHTCAQPLSRSAMPTQVLHPHLCLSRATMFADFPGSVASHNINLRSVSHFYFQESRLPHFSWLPLGTVSS